MHPLDDVTLASYQAGAGRYAERTPALGPHLSAYLDSLTALLPAGATVLEVGSGPGRAATYLESTHLSVRRTDATPAFVEMMHADGHDASMLDVRTDDLGGPYDAILATAVLLHLTRGEFETFLHRAHAAITPGGLLAFTVKEGDGSQWTTEKLDLPRRFTYWREPALRTLMANARWTPLSVTKVRMNQSWIFVIARSDAPTTECAESSSPLPTTALNLATQQNGVPATCSASQERFESGPAAGPGPRPRWLGAYES